jgi:branched-chain amino acid transport system ATP-binding protein
MSPGMSPQTALLSVEAVDAGYGDVQVLHGAGLQVEAGRIACLIGSNGAGKSTLLNTISGFVPAARGAIRFAGDDLTNATPKAIVAAGVIQVPEGRRLFAGMTVTENLLLGAYLRTDGRAAIRRDLGFVLEIFPRLAERAAQDAATLSGGEQQMCAIGRGIMAKPSLLMIDELSLGLAPRLVDELSVALKTINRTGVAMLVVEQDVMTALDLADVGFVLDEGRVTLSGPSAALAGDPSVREAYLGIAPELVALPSG